MGNTVRWYWSADTLFCQLSIDHNIDVQSASSWAPRVVRKWESKHWFSCGVEGLPGAVGWCIVTWLPNFLGWVDLQSYGAPPMRTLHACGAPLWRTITKINSSNKCSYMISVTSTLGTNLGHGLLHYSPPSWHYYLHLEKQKLQWWKNFAPQKTAVVHCIGLDCCDKHLQRMYMILLTVSWCIELIITALKRIQLLKPCQYSLACFLGSGGPVETLWVNRWHCTFSK